MNKQKLNNKQRGGEGENLKQILILKLIYSWINS
jgi:hypothetical protein